MFGVAGTQAEPAAIGQDAAHGRGTEWMGRRVDGTIGERRSDGDDRFPPEG